VTGLPSVRFALAAARSRSCARRFGPIAGRYSRGAPIRNDITGREPGGLFRCFEPSGGALALGAIVLEHEKADRRGKIVMLATSVDG
jgi:hypothetical protein